MGLGLALTEAFVSEGGIPVTDTLKSLGILPAASMPPVDVIIVEEQQPEGPYGAKGAGEAVLVPTPAAVAGALFAFDGVRRTALPMRDSAAARAALPRVDLLPRAGDAPPAAGAAAGDGRRAPEAREASCPRSRRASSARTTTSTRRSRAGCRRRRSPTDFARDPRADLVAPRHGAGPRDDPLVGDARRPRGARERARPRSSTTTSPRTRSRAAWTSSPRRAPRSASASLLAYGDHRPPRPRRRPARPRRERALHPCRRPRARGDPRRLHLLRRVARARPPASPRTSAWASTSTSARVSGDATRPAGSPVSRGTTGSSRTASTCPTDHDLRGTILHNPMSNLNNAVGLREPGALREPGGAGHGRDRRERPRGVPAGLRPPALGRRHLRAGHGLVMARDRLGPGPGGARRRGRLVVRPDGPLARRVHPGDHAPPRSRSAARSSSTMAGRRGWTPTRSARRPASRPPASTPASELGPGGPLWRTLQGQVPAECLVDLGHDRPRDHAESGADAGNVNGSHLLGLGLRISAEGPCPMPGAGPETDRSARRSTSPARP